MTHTGAWSLRSTAGLDRYAAQTLCAVPVWQSKRRISALAFKLEVKCTAYIVPRGVQLEVRCRSDFPAPSRAQSPRWRRTIARWPVSRTRSLHGPHPRVGPPGRRSFPRVRVASTPASLPPFRLGRLASDPGSELRVKESATAHLPPAGALPGRGASACEVRFEVRSHGSALRPG
jgi:hypothetical protein